MNQRWLITAGIAGLALGSAEAVPPVIPGVIPAVPTNSLPAVGLLPEGSNLKGVLMPRYDSQKNLVATLRSDLMTVVTREEIEALGVRVKMYEPDGGDRGELTMRRALYNHGSGMLRSDQPVEVRTPSIHARGSGMVLQLPRNNQGGNTTLEGFLLGPVSTSFYTDRRTAMNCPSTLSSLAIVCLALTEAAPAGPTPLSPEELHAIDLQVEAGRAPDHGQESTRIIAAGEQGAKVAAERMHAFARRAAIPVDNQPAKPQPAAEQPKAEASEPASQPGRLEIKVQSDGGMYFDAAKNLIVYTKNIRLSEARFDLECADQLQVFLKSEPKKSKGDEPKPGEQPKPEAKEPKEPKEAKSKGDGAGLLDAGAGVSGVERIIATGKVKVTSKDPKGNAIVATAETAIYEAETGAFILKGGLPQIQRGPSCLRALEPGIYIRYTKDGDFEMSDGKKETFFVLPEKKK